MSSVERRRTSVDFPEPFWPRMATHSPRAIVNVTSASAGHGFLRAKRPAFLSLRLNVLRKSLTSTAGTLRSRRAGKSDVDGARVMLLLQKLEVDGTEDWRPPNRRRADLEVAQAWRGSATPGRDPSRHVREQHKAARLSALEANVKFPARTG